MVFNLLVISSRRPENSGISLNDFLSIILYILINCSPVLVDYYWITTCERYFIVGYVTIQVTYTESIVIVD